MALPLRLTQTAADCFRLTVQPLLGAVRTGLQSACVCRLNRRTNALISYPYTIAELCCLSSIGQPRDSRPVGFWKSLPIPRDQHTHDGHSLIVERPIVGQALMSVCLLVFAVAMQRCAAGVVS